MPNQGTPKILLTCYAWEKDVSAAPFVGRFDRLIQQFGLRPYWYNLEVDRGKIITGKFGGLRKRLQKIDINRLTTFGYEASRQSEGGDELHMGFYSHDWQLYYIIDIPIAGSGNYRDIMERELVEFIDRCGPCYGFITGLPPGFNGLGYATGTIFIPGMSGIEAQRTSSFRSAFMSGTALRRRMRDVYPVNALTDQHLEAQIDGISLRAWIGAGGRGSLESPAPGAWIWKLSPFELPVVRSKLLESGLLIVPV